MYSARILSFWATFYTMDNENTELNAEQIDDLRCFKIPLMGSDDTVVIYENELPDDINKIIQLLQSEVVPLCHWIQIAVWKRLSNWNSVGRVF